MYVFFGGCSSCEHDCEPNISLTNFDKILHTKFYEKFHTTNFIYGLAYISNGIT